MRVPKLRKDGTPKRSGLCEGDRRVARTLQFKLQVVEEYRSLQQGKAEGRCRAPIFEAAERFGIHASLVSKWAAKEDEIRSAIVTKASSARLTLHPGSKCRFPLAEAEVYAVYQRQRAQGQRVTARVLRAVMRRSINECHGQEAAASFRASHRWLQAFTRRHRMSLRRKTNSKHQPVESRISKCQRWHARFRRRLQRGTFEGAHMHEKWGRWLPENRISIDQVPCNLRDGDGRTYADVGSKRVWLVGTKQDDGKRFCTLQIAARCSNGTSDLSRRGQPKLSIVFRGTGKRIAPEERSLWHADVHVRFQPKAWADDALCEEYALMEMEEITAAARREDRESVAVFDNLHGQTTRKHLVNLARNRCKRHLLPSNTTDELQLVDAGVGHALKTEMAHLHDDWLAQDSNLEAWTSNLPMWRKRVLITQLAATAWENVCAGFDFEAAAERIGMRMTVDGSGDDLIKIQGVDQYSFCDADGGSSDCESDEGFEQPSACHAEPHEEDCAAGGSCNMQHPHARVEEALHRAQEEEQYTGPIAGCQEDVSMRNALPDSGHSRRGTTRGAGLQGLLRTTDSDAEASPIRDFLQQKEDENHENTTTVASYLLRAVPPVGYTVIEECPPLETKRQRLALVGKLVLHGWEDNVRTGWFLGRVARKRVTARDRQDVPTANYVVRYTAKQTNGQVDGLVACELSARNYGVGQWWVLLNPV